MDKEMEKKRSPAKSQGRKGQPTAQQTNPTTDPVQIGSGTAAAHLNRSTAAEFHARVAKRAYELFERRGGRSGDANEDWLAAEQLVNEETARENL